MQMDIFHSGTSSQHKSNPLHQQSLTWLQGSDFLCTSRGGKTGGQTVWATDQNVYFLVLVGLTKNTLQKITCFFKLLMCHI